MIYRGLAQCVVVIYGVCDMTHSELLESRYFPRKSLFGDDFSDNNASTRSVGVFILFYHQFQRTIVLRQHRKTLLIRIMVTAPYSQLWVNYFFWVFCKTSGDWPFAVRVRQIFALRIKTVKSLKRVNQPLEEQLRSLTCSWAGGIVLIYIVRNTVRTHVC